MNVPIYTFGLGDDSVETSPEVLGGKGAGLVWMSQHNVSVPPGFIIPTTMWQHYFEQPTDTMNAIKVAIQPYLKRLEQHFGYMPLLSVRSGARVSMPGMMDTVLNVGLDKSNFDFWHGLLPPKCVDDCWHRLVTMYGSVVNGVDRKKLEEAGSNAATVWSAVTGIIAFPNAEQQIMGCIEAVFKSWMNPRAIEYRKLHGYPEDWGTAVTVQAMVFGNLNDNSGTGVLFTRNPDTGLAAVTGEFLVNAQGEDVVAGIRTPKSLAEMSEWSADLTHQLFETVLGLEKLKRDVQDVEFTVQDGKLYLLQTRNAKRTAKASVVIAMDMVKEGLISEKEAVKRVDAKQLDLAQQRVVDPAYKVAPDFVGLPACSGVVTGLGVHSSETAVASKKPCILVTHETTPDDISGMIASVGVITMTGGATSHAAVVARGMNKACVVGVGASIEEFGNDKLITMDGATGRIWVDKAVPVIDGADCTHIWEFKQLVQKLSESAPIISGIPDASMKKALLFLGEAITDTNKAMLTILGARNKVGKLYVDLTYSEEYDSFMSMFGHNCLIRLLKRISESGEALKGVKFISDIAIPNVDTVSGLNDLESLVMAKGEIVTGATSKAFTPAFQKVLEWKQKEGLTYISLGKRGPSDGNCQSFLSFEQALQEASK